MSLPRIPLFDLQRAILAARQRSNNPYVSAHAEAGNVQIVLAVPTAGGVYDITPLTGWVSVDEAIEFLSTHTG